MASMEIFLLRIKPAIHTFLQTPSREILAHLETELQQFNWLEIKLFHVQILLPLVIKLEALSEHPDQDLRTGTINCIRTVISKLYLNEVKGLRTILVILLKQIHDCHTATTKVHLSEELILATVQCMSEALCRSTTDVLEQFYTKESTLILGQMLLALVELVDKHKFRTLVISAINCLMVVFYVHDAADAGDVVLRNQVANNLFMYLPKIITTLSKKSLADEKLGETLKSTAVRALGRILCIMYEKADDAIVESQYDSSQFRQLFNDVLHIQHSSKSEAMDTYDIFVRQKDQLDERLKRMQNDGRTEQWFSATSHKLRRIFLQTSVLRSHQSTRLRQEYAEMSCLLLERCGSHLHENFLLMLENVVAMSEDNDEHVRRPCQTTLQRLQSDDKTSESIFDASCEVLFDEHLSKLPRIINRCVEAEQYAELVFLKGYLRHLSAKKLRLVLAVPKTMEMFCMCLLAAIDLDASSDFLSEEYSLRQMTEADQSESAKLHWRQFKNLSSVRCIQTVQDILTNLGRLPQLNRMLYEHLAELLAQESAVMNEIILAMLWLTTGNGNKCHDETLDLVHLFLKEVLNEKHWHLALRPDQPWRLKVNKTTNWFVDSTPGLYESAIEVRTQDFDSDDENDANNSDVRNRVSIVDAKFNVLHTCLTLDALAHCATFLGETFDKYVFRSLHRVLLKVANSNTMVYQASTYALICMQNALHLVKIPQLIEMHSDYLTYHLNTILKKTPESNCAVEILTVLLQLSSRNTLPHLESIFQTIREECCKDYHSENVISYLKVYNAFLTHVSCWQLATSKEVNDVPMQVEHFALNADAVYTNWLNILEKPKVGSEEPVSTDTSETVGEEMGIDDAEEETHAADTQACLPRHVEIAKDILQQVLKLVSSSNKVHQILALECLTTGVPILSHYEDELLPIVHLIWSPLLEKFRQRDAIILNRCFSLLNTLATYAKAFILKRSLDDIVPFLLQFLKEAATHNDLETSKVQTQEYKLQRNLLQQFPNLIQSMEIDGKPLNEIVEVVAQYLSQEQPKELQQLSVDFFTTIRLYNGPLVYLVTLKRSHLKAYAQNAAKVLSAFSLKQS